MTSNFFTIGLFCLAIFVSSCNNDVVHKADNRLPIIGIHEYDEEIGDTIYHSVPSFSFINQNGRVFSTNEVKDKIKVVNFFFSSCPSICPAMMKQLKRFQSLTDVDVHIISLSVDPLTDSADKLRRYVRLREIDTTNWDLLTGDKEEIYTLGTKDMFLAVQEDVLAPGGFLHSENLLLLDPQMRIRGVYAGTDSEEVDKLIKDIKKLEKECQLQN